MDRPPITEVVEAIKIHGARKATMAIQGLRDLSDLSVQQLYSVYVDVARADFHWRLSAMYGTQTPPAGHALFRPLPMELFQQRYAMADQIVGGRHVLCQRLSRQAAAYGVDVDAAVTRLGQAA